MMVNLGRFKDEMATSLVSDEEEMSGGGTPVGMMAGLGGGGGTSKPLPLVPANQGPPTVPLVVLLDFAVQKTYHELIVLSELLPKKSDQDRKISIVQFAHSTRKLFIRLLALVKWVKVSGKVNESCTAISYLLDQQASYFVDTADRLHELARGELANARLPAFQIPAAVDVLTLGSYPRLPVCIKSRFVPEDRINDRELSCVLQRLNQVIQYKLYATARPLPRLMRHVSIKNGMATFIVPGEFEASLTLLGEVPDVTWSLLHVKILVEDFVVGDGADLVHPLQLNYLHEVVQNRISAAGDKAIGELYAVLHSFCLSVQLDVLYCQSMTLIHDRLHPHMAIDAYKTGKQLVISYWKHQHVSKSQTGRFSTQKGGSVQYRICVEAEQEGLKIRHHPVADERLPDCLGGQEAQLSIENLITETATVRSRQKLRQLKANLEKTANLKCEETGTTVAELTTPILLPSNSEECLCFTVNVFSGRFVATIKELGGSRRLKDLQQALNSGQLGLVRGILAGLRVELVERRCKQAVAHLPVRIVSGLGKVAKGARSLDEIPKDRLYLQFTRYDSFYMVLGFRDEKESFRVEYFLVSTADSDLSSFPNRNRNTSARAGVCAVQIDPRHVFNTYSQIITKDITNLNEPSVRRKTSAVAFFLTEPDRKLGTKWRPKTHSELPTKIPRMWEELAVTVSVCDQRIPFFLLSGELGRRGVMHQSCMLEGAIGGMLLRVIRLPRAQLELSEVSSSALHSAGIPIASLMWRNVIACNIRVLHDPAKSSLDWSFEVVFVDPPLIGVGQKAETDSKGVVFRKPVSEENAGKSVDEFLNAVCAFSRLYMPVQEFSKILKEKMSHYIQVKMYSYHRLVLGYGPHFGYNVTIQWKHVENSFHLSFGVQGNKIDGSNPHALVAPRLKAGFNQRPDIAWLAQTLHDTIRPLLAIRGLKEEPMMELQTSQLQQAQGSTAQPSYSPAVRFSVIPVAETTVRILFRGQTTFEVGCLSDEWVGVRDCTAAVSTEKTVAGSFLPIPSFREFLDKFQADESDADAEGTTAEGLREMKEAPPSVGSFMHLTSPGSVQEPGSVLDSVSMPGSVPPPGSQQPPSQQATGGPGSVPGGLGPMTPSPAPLLSNAPLLTPSPAQPMSISAMVAMTPSPGLFTQPSPAPPPSHQPTATKFTESGNRKQMYASSKPVLMKHSAFAKLCKAKENGISPLEDYLNALITLKAFEKSPEVTNPLVKPGLFAFSQKGVDFEFYLDPLSEWPLRVALRLPGSETFTQDHVPVLERYFAEKVGPTGSSNAILTFVKILGLTFKEANGVARSYVSLMNHELNPDPSLRYRVWVCLLTPPPHACAMYPQKMNFKAGTSCLRLNQGQDAILFFVQLTPNDPSRSRRPGALPLIYKINKNTIQLAEEHDIPPLLHPVKLILDRQNATAERVKDCAMWPAMRDLCENLEWKDVLQQ